MSNSFCRFLSNGLSLSRNSADKIIVKPCGWHKSKIEFDSIKRVGSAFNNVTDWTPECVTCRQQEDAGFTSYRKTSFNIIKNVDHTKPVVLDISIDNNCNAACVMCGPESSSTWHKQYTQNFLPIKNINYNITEDLINLIKSINYSEVSRIRFFGGEPLIGNTHLVSLEQIPDPSKVTVWYTTNASVKLNDNILKTWEKFQTVILAISIDGIDQQFDYIRWPLRWDKIVSNLQTMRDEVPTNVLFRINHTLNPFNIYYYDRLENWVNENFYSNRLGDKVEINVHPAWGDWALTKTPELLRNKIYEKYGDSSIAKFLKTMPQDSVQTLQRFIETWEPIRKNNWQLVFPEIVDYFR